MNKLISLMLAAILLLVVTASSQAASLATAEQKSAARNEAPTPRSQQSKTPAKEEAPAKVAEQAKSESTDSEATPLSKEALPNAKETDKSTKGSGSSLGRTILGLLVVLGVIWGVHALLKRAKKNNLFSSSLGSAHAIDVLATTPLAPGRSLHIVRIGSQTLVVGATEQTITKLATVGDDELGEIISSNTSRLPTGTAPVKGSLLEKIQKMTTR